MNRTRDASCACLLACSPAAETAAPCVGLPRLARPPASAPANELHATAQTLWRASLSNPALGLQCRMCHCQQPPVGRCSQARWLVAATDAGRRPRPWMTRSGCGRSPGAVPQRRPLPQAPNARCRCEALLQLAGWLAGLLAMLAGRRAAVSTFLCASFARSAIVPRGACCDAICCAVILLYGVRT